MLTRGPAWSTVREAGAGTQTAGADMDAVAGPPCQRRSYGRQYMLRCGRRCCRARAGRTRKLLSGRLSSSPWIGAESARQEPSSSGVPMRSECPSSKARALIFASETIDEA